MSLKKSLKVGVLVAAISVSVYAVADNAVTSLLSSLH
jgi:hypothetical protein